MFSFWSKDPSKDFPYDVLDVSHRLDNKSLWTIHRGKKRTNGEPVSIFRFDSSPGKERLLDLAKFAAKKLKSLRHPNILTFIDSLETDKSVVIVTESCEPIDEYLEKINEYTIEQKKGSISWGLYQVAKGLDFLITCSLNHNNINSGSVFVTSDGSWKISNLEYVTQEPDREVPRKHLACLEVYDPPESSKATKWSSDSFGLGILIWEIFNGNVSSPSSLKSPGKVPKSLQAAFSELTSATASKRPSPAQFLDKVRSNKGFMANHFVEAMLFLEEITIKENTEKNRFFTNLDGHLDTFPPDSLKTKILSQLITAFEFGNAGAPVLGPLFKIGLQLEDEEYQKRIVPCIVKLFASKDRATRAKLLQQTENFAKHLSKNIINEQIYPNIAQGFVDSNPTIREQTVKCMLHLASKLSYANLNEDLLGHFARLQTRDEEGGIRTNTTVCLGKIAGNLHPTVRQKALIPAFLRSMRDPFAPARIAGILALSVTQPYYSLRETATKVMPALCHLTMDPDRGVRDQAFKALKGFMSKMEKVSEDPSLAASMEADINKAGTEASSALSATWASWAVSSLTSKFYGSKISKDSSSSSAPSSQSAVSGNISSPSEVSKPVLADESKKHESSTKNEESESVFGTSNSNGWEDESVPWDEDEDVIQNSKEPEMTSSSWNEDPVEPPIQTVMHEEKKERRRREPEKTEVKDVEITRETVSRDARKVKKGPMKLGAMKVKM